MNAEQLLAQFGITMDDAREWIMSNLNNPETIYNTALTFGIDSSMLAEIVSPVVEGANAQLVEGFFSSYGLDGSALNSNNIGSGSAGDLDDINPLAIELAQLIVQPNDNTGVLSTDYLKQQVITQTGQSAYDQFFDPALYDSDGDGYLSEADFGGELNNLFDFSSASAESIYYGTIINMFQAIDQSESMMISQLDPNSSEEAYLQALISVFEDEANPPLIPDAQLSQTIIFTTATAIGGFDGEGFTLSPADYFIA